MMSKQIIIKTDAGTLFLQGDEGSQTADVTFMPNDHGEEIDLIHISCTDKNDRDSYHPNHDKLKNINVHCYEDVWDENYTHAFRIDTDEAVKSLDEPYQPDSHKL